ncbi:MULTISPECIES: hypothetical protein [unclassified Massilia]|uniref:hypothetical protein n=1 Tax=unclassified Massilia TaxID=2609279 RepID=UPI00177E374A|nr:MULTISPECIES: hypothetical protein [unclassified Massilia]MBD8531512.1 hypothetical protein [Massilia sp. CFBP 13647]MBD8673692.1 hypothetical protein [Massilia sp. CFBP 13721]
MKINVSVSISRNSSDEISLTFVDQASRAKFLDVRMTPEAFAMAVTGQAFIDAPAEVRALDVVGKRKITERRSIECPLDIFNKDEIVAWLGENGKEEGWTVNTYLGSQGSIARRGDKTIINYSVYRFDQEG